MISYLEWVILLILSIWKDIKKFDFTKTLLVLMAPSLGFVVAYYSGHVFGWISPSYILVLTLAFLYFECQIGKKIILCEK